MSRWTFTWMKICSKLEDKTQRPSLYRNRKSINQKALLCTQRDSQSHHMEINLMTFHPPC